MKNRNPLTKLTLLLAVLLTLGAARAQADILPGVSIDFARSLEVFNDNTGATTVFMGAVSP